MLENALKILNEILSLKNNFLEQTKYQLERYNLNVFLYETNSSSSQLVCFTSLLLWKAEQLEDKNKTQIKVLCESVKCHDATEFNKTPSIYTCERSNILSFQD